MGAGTAREQASVDIIIIIIIGSGGHLAVGRSQPPRRLDAVWQCRAAQLVEMEVLTLVAVVVCGESGRLERRRREGDESARWRSGGPFPQRDRARERERAAALLALALAVAIDSRSIEGAPLHTSFSAKCGDWRQDLEAEKWE